MDQQQAVVVVKQLFMSGFGAMPVLASGLRRWPRLGSGARVWTARHANPTRTNNQRPFGDTYRPQPLHLVVRPRTWIGGARDHYIVLQPATAQVDALAKEGSKTISIKPRILVTSQPDTLERRQSPIYLKKGFPVRASVRGKTRAQSG